MTFRVFYPGYSGVLAAVLTVPTTAFAISITPTTSQTDLVSALVLNSPLTVVGGTQSFSGSAGQAGLYENPQGTYGLPAQGIVLSTGNVEDYETIPVDTNTTPDVNGSSSSNTTSFSVPATQTQENLLFPITGRSNHNDVAELSFDFVLTDQSVGALNFTATFGSEEWSQFVGSTFIDGFGLYVNGVNVAAAQETGTSAPTAPLAININHPDMQDIPGTELDGILAPNDNPVLQFQVPIGLGELIVPGELSTFTAIIADASDSFLDTTVYLSSFFAEPGDDNPGSLFDGSNENFPLLPSNPPDPETGEFIIDIPTPDPDAIIWVDPPVSIGYEYAVIGAGVAIDEISAPSLATVADLDGYIISDGITSVAIGAGQTIDVLAEFGAPLTEFTLTGIDPALMLDADDPLAFPLGIGVTTGTSFSLSVTPIVAPIPLPAGLPLYLGGVLLGGMLLRRRARR